MYFVYLFIFVTTTSTVPIVWDFPPLRNLTMSPAIQQALEEGHALARSGKLENFPVTGPSEAKNQPPYDSVMESSTVQYPRFPLAPVYCISYLCIGDLLGMSNLTSTESMTSSTEYAISTGVPIGELKSELKSSSDDYENLAKAAVVFFSSVPGVLLLVFMTLGERRKKKFIFYFF
jgi:hypothetical protein